MPNICVFVLLYMQVTKYEKTTKTKPKYQKTKTSTRNGNSQKSEPGKQRSSENTPRPLKYPRIFKFGPLKKFVMLAEVIPQNFEFTKITPKLIVNQTGPFYNTKPKINPTQHHPTCWPNPVTQSPHQKYITRYPI